MYLTRLLLALACVALCCACAPTTSGAASSDPADGTNQCVRDEDCTGLIPKCLYDANCQRTCAPPPCGAGRGPSWAVCGCEGKVVENDGGCESTWNRIYNVGPAICSDGAFERCAQTELLGRPCKLEGEAASADRAELTGNELGEFEGMTLRAMRNGKLEPDFSHTIREGAVQVAFSHQPGHGFFVDRNGNGSCDRGEPALPYYRSIADDGSRQYIHLVTGVPLPECSELR